MVFEAVALEVLYRVELAVRWAGRLDRFADRITEKREAAVLLPVGQEGAAEQVPGAREVELTGAGRRHGSRIESAARCHGPPQQAKQDFTGRARVFGMVFEAVALKVLHPVGLPV